MFTALADFLYQGADTAEVCAAICVAATLLVPGCDHASVLMRRNDHFVTVAASDRIARHVDSLERDWSRGRVWTPSKTKPLKSNPTWPTPGAGRNWQPGWCRRPLSAARWGFGYWSTTAKSGR